MNDMNVNKGVSLVVLVILCFVPVLILRIVGEVCSSIAEWYDDTLDRAIHGESST